MAIEAISAITREGPVLVIDRVRELGTQTVRAVDASQVIGPEALEPSQISTPSAPPAQTTSDELITDSVEQAVRLSGEFEEDFEITAATTPQPQQVALASYQRLVLFGSFYIDVMV